MGAYSEQSSSGRVARAVNPCDPSPRFVSSVVERIGTNPLNFRVLEAVVSGVTLRNVATVTGIDQQSVLELVQDMKTAMRVRNSMAMVAFGLDNGLLDADTMARKFNFDRYGSLLPKERNLVDILAAKGSWGKSDQELPSALGIVDMTSCRLEINRLCLKLGVENLMQLRVYEYLRPKTLTKAEPNPDLSKSLSLREIEIIEFKARGLSDNEAGRQLGISGLTVRWHLTNAMKASGQSSQIEMVADLIKTGLLDRRSLSEGLDFSRYQQLTEREREIFGVVTNEANLCQSLEDIAFELQISSALLNNYLVKMYAVLGVKDVWGLKIYGLLLPQRIRDASPEKEEELGNEEKTLEQKRTLTEREIEVVELLAYGFRYKQIAEQLGITEQTVKNNMLRITHRGGRPETTLEAILALMDEGVLDKNKLSKGLDFSKYRQLTEREREVLKVLADNPDLQQDGLAQKMVPAISRQVYKTHAAKIIHKLDVKNSIQAAVYYRLLPEEIRDASAEEADEAGHTRSLTEREIEVIELIACGFQYKQVAEQLHVSENTAKNHMANITHRSGRPETALEVILAIMDEGVLGRQRLSKGLDFSRYQQLTEREKEMLRVLVDNPGLSRDGLAQKMVPAISPRVYKNLAAKIIHKLGVKKSIQAAVYYRLLPDEIK